MSGKQSAATDKALRMIARGSTAYAAAKKHGIALSTIYRALRRQRSDVNLMGPNSAKVKKGDASAL